MGRTTEHRGSRLTFLTASGQVSGRKKTKVFDGGARHRPPDSEGPCRNAFSWLEGPSSWSQPRASLLASDAALWRRGRREGNVRRIRAGMTLRQVRAILGRPGKGQFFGSGPQTLLWLEGPAGVAFVSFRTHERAEPAEGAGVIRA